MMGWLISGEQMRGKKDIDEKGKGDKEEEYTQWQKKYDGRPVAVLS